MRFIVIIAILILAGCPSIQSMDNFGKSWVGESLERYKQAYERTHRWSDVASERRGNTIIYRVIENHFKFGSCYLDLVVNQHTGLIIDYQVSGDEYACK